jgi:hypothetical protein
MYYFFATHLFAGPVSTANELLGFLSKTDAKPDGSRRYRYKKQPRKMRFFPRMA